MKPVALLLAVLALSPPLPAADWPWWRGPSHDGISEESVPLPLAETLPVAWKVEVGTGFSTVSVAGDRVLTMGNEGDRDTVWCLDAASGEVLWKHTYDCELDPRYYEGGPGGTPTIHEGAVYTLSKKGHAYRFDLETGEVTWSRDLLADHDFELPEWSFACSPFVDGDRVLYNVGRGGLALSRETGKTLWMPTTETSGYATVVPYPTPENPSVHLLFSAKSLLAFDSDSGESYWSYPWKSSRDVNAADPLVIGDRLMVSSSAGTEMLSLGEGRSEPEKLWKQHDLKWYFNPGVRIGDHVYSLHGTTHRPTELTCTDIATGETVWAEEGFGSGGLVAAGEVVIVFDNGMLTLFRASPEKYDPIHQQKILEGKCWTSPVLSNGRVYCRTAEGELAAVVLAGAEDEG